MKSIKEKFSGLSILIILASMIFMSCDVEWMANLRNSIDQEISGTITFYSEKEGAGITPKTFSKSYRIGETVTESALPSDSSSEIANWKPTDNSKLAYWEFYRTTLAQTDMTAKGRFDYYLMNDVDIDVAAHWYYRAFVITSMDDVTGTSQYVDTKDVWGDNGETITITPDPIEGFTVLPTSVVISDTLANICSVSYTRNKPNLTLDYNGGNVAGITSGIVLNAYYYDADFPDVSAMTPTRTGYVFAGWNPSLPAKVPANDTTYTATWANQSYNIIYKDCYCKDFSGSTTGLATECYYGVETELVSAEPVEGGAKRRLTGLYSDSNCTLELSKNASGKYLIPSTNGDYTVYAKWQYSNVYVDPVSGDDDNTGYSSSKAVKTVAEAKKYLIDSNPADDPALVVVNTITAETDIDNLSSLTTVGYANTVVKPLSTFNGPVLAVDTLCAKPIENVTIDGESITRNQSAVLIKDSGKLTFGDEFKISNFVHTDSALGVVVVAENGELELSNGSKITDTSALNPGTGIYIKGKLTATGGTVSGMANSLVVSATGTCEFDGSPELTTGIMLYAPSAIKLLADVTNNYMIYSDSHTSGPVVLTGSYVATSYDKFVCGHPGYAINSSGAVVKASTIAITPSNPAVQYIDPGVPVSLSVKENSPNETILVLNVTDDAYDNIAVWGGKKYIQYTFNGKYATAEITGSAGSYKADLNLTKAYINGAFDSNMNLFKGINSLTIYAASDDADTIINSKNYEIYVY